MIKTESPKYKSAVFILITALVVTFSTQSISYGQDAVTFSNVSCTESGGFPRFELTLSGTVRANEDVKGLKVWITGTEIPIDSGGIPAFYSDGPYTYVGGHLIGDLSSGETKSFNYSLSTGIFSYGSCGMIHEYLPPVDPTPEPEQTQPLNKLSASGQISFSELMFTSLGGPQSLPQWIELYNNSDTETVNLRSWVLKIEARDANGTHRHNVIQLEEFTIAPNQTALIVTEYGEHSVEIPDSRVYNFFSHHSDEFGQDLHKNMVLGQAGFYLQLMDPDRVISDTVGNIDGNRATKDEPLWEIPEGTTQDGARTSLFRRYAKNTDNPLDGTNSKNWRRAANFGRAGNLPALVKLLYWGRKTDIGNPGFKGTGALPVELSSFNAILKGTSVVLKWTTESELDNAGFYIYRSETKNGEFTVVNASMIQGAGTTAERNEYTWTDTTAKPNTVYYYQIEDVSHAGERKRLATIRLRGLVSASGKLMTRWAEQKMLIR